ncbi:MAG: hypothetical protein WC915_03475 [archaeon]|jgi:hypothetical protein
MPSRKHLPNPFTHERREQSGVARREYIEILEKAMRGINPSIERSIPLELKHIRREGTKRGLHKSLILHREAEKLDELASRYTDHLISGLRKAKVIETPTQEREMWERQFDNFIERRVKKLGIRHVADLIREIDSINEYTSLPKVIFEARKTNPKEHIELTNKLLRDHVNPELNLFQNVNHTLARKSLPKDNQRQTQLQLKAIDICTAASIYADLKKAQSPNQTHIISWTRHFRNGMHLIWESNLIPDNVAQAIKKLER